MKNSILLIVMTIFTFIVISCQNDLTSKDKDEELGLKWAAYLVSNPEVSITDTIFEGCYWNNQSYTSAETQGNVIPYNLGKTLPVTKGAQWVYLVRPFVNIKTYQSTKDHLKNRGWEPAPLNYFSAMLKQHKELIMTTYSHILCLDITMVNNENKPVYIVTDTNPEIGALLIISLLEKNENGGWTKELLIPCLKITE